MIKKTVIRYVKFVYNELIYLDGIIQCSIQFIRTNKTEIIEIQTKSSKSVK